MAGPSKNGCSQLLTYTGCSTEGVLAYAVGLRPRIVSDALSIGTAVHSALEWHQRNRRGDALELGLREFVENDTRNLEHVDLALDILEAYRREFAVSERAEEPIFAEEEMTATVGQLDPEGPWPELDEERFSIKIDYGFADRIVPSVWTICDYKTESWTGKDGLLVPWDASDPFSGSLQAMSYHTVVRLLFPDVELRPFTIIRILKTYPYQFARVPLRFSPVAYSTIGRNIRHYVKHKADIHAMLLAGAPIPKNFAMCKRVFDPDGRRLFSDCVYRKLCHASSTTAAEEIARTLFVQSSAGTQASRFNHPGESSCQ